LLPVTTATTLVTSHYSNKQHLSPVTTATNNTCHQSLQQQTTLAKVSVPEVTVAHHSSMDTSASLDLQSALTQHAGVKTVILQPLAAAITTVVYNCEMLMDNRDSVFSRTEKGRRSKERFEQI
jgi:hypothetical protein